MARILITHSMRFAARSSARSLIRLEGLSMILSSQEDRKVEVYVQMHKEYASAKFGCICMNKLDKDASFSLLHMFWHLRRKCLNSVTATLLNPLIFRLLDEFGGKHYTLHFKHSNFDLTSIRFDSIKTLMPTASLSEFRKHIKSSELTVYDYDEESNNKEASYLTMEGSSCKSAMIAFCVERFIDNVIQVR